MKIAVMGAGAVGCYFGGMLARAGHEVVLIGRPAHVEAVQRQGLPTDAGTTVLLKPGRPVLINRPAGSGADILSQAKPY